MVFKKAQVEVPIMTQSLNSILLRSPKIDSKGTNSAWLAGRYYNAIPTRFLAPIDCLKIPAQETGQQRNILIGEGWLMTGPDLECVVYEGEAAAGHLLRVPHLQ
jgi:hypothetical protein